MTDTSTAAAVFDWDSPPPAGGTEHALRLAHWHFQFENPEQLHMLEQLYHDDIVWEVPSRRVIHHGKREVLENYARIFESCAEPMIEPVEQYATAQRVFDDLEMTFKLVDSKGFPNHPLPVGTRVAMRVVHNFHIQDGLIIRENGYEIWRPDISWYVVSGPVQRELLCG